MQTNVSISLVCTSALIFKSYVHRGTVWRYISLWFVTSEHLVCVYTYLIVLYTWGHIKFSQVKRGHKFKKPNTRQWLPVSHFCSCKGPHLGWQPETSLLCCALFCSSILHLFSSSTRANKSHSTHTKHCATCAKPCSLDGTPGRALRQVILAGGHQENKPLSKEVEQVISSPALEYLTAGPRGSWATWRRAMMLPGEVSAQRHHGSPITKTSREKWWSCKVTLKWWLSMSPPNSQQLIHKPCDTANVYWTSHSYQGPNKTLPPWHPLTASHGLKPKARKSLGLPVPNATVSYSLSLWAYARE